MMRKKISVSIANIAAAATIFIAGIVHAADCSDILKMGIHNTYQSITASNAKSAYKNDLCDEHSNLRTGNTKASLSGQYKLIGGSGSYSQENTETIASKYCDKNSGDLSDEDLNELVVMTIDPYIVSNWNDCMKSGGKGLFGNIDVNGSHVSFTLVWQGFADVNEVTISPAPYSSNLDCPQAIFHAGTKLKNNTEISETCTRIGEEEVNFTVNTSGGSKILKLASLAHPLPQNPQFHYISSGIYTSPPPSHQVGSADVVVESRNNYKRYTISFIAPKVPVNTPTGPFGPPPPIYHNVSFSAWRQGGGNLPPGTLPTLSGTWHPGDTVKVTVDVPSMFDGAAGWKMTYCIGDQEVPCYTGVDFLTGSPR